MKLNTSKITISNLWDVIQEHEGKSFLTKKGLPFTYVIKGGELFTDRRERSITRSTFEKAYAKLIKDQEGEKCPQSYYRPQDAECIWRPLRMGCFYRYRFNRRTTVYSAGNGTLTGRCRHSKLTDSLKRRNPVSGTCDNGCGA